MKRNNSHLQKMRDSAVEFIKTDLIPNSRDHTWNLTKLTGWGFWSDTGGLEMVSIDSLLGHQIAEALLREVEYAPEYFLIELNEIFNFINPDLLEND